MVKMLAPTLYMYPTRASLDPRTKTSYHEEGQDPGVENKLTVTVREGGGNGKQGGGTRQVMMEARGKVVRSQLVV